MTAPAPPNNRRLFLVESMRRCAGLVQIGLNHIAVAAIGQAIKHAIDLEVINPSRAPLSRHASPLLYSRGIARAIQIPASRAFRLRRENLIHLPLQPVVHHLQLRRLRGEEIAVRCIQGWPWYGLIDFKKLFNGLPFNGPRLRLVFARAVVDLLVTYVADNG